MKRILILGGGYVGIDAYRSVMRRAGAQVRSGEIEVVVVNNTSYHTFHGFTGEVLGDQVCLNHTLTPLKPLMPHAQVLEGTATAVNAEQQFVQVRLPGGQVRPIAFDHLLIGTGSRDPFERIPGLLEHASRLKHTQDMQAFRERVHQRLQARQRTTFAVVGGGFAGVEMAAALQERLTRERVPGTVHLISSGGVLDCLQGRFGRLAEHARRSLVRAGVRLHTGLRVTRVLPGAVELHNGQRLHADEVLYAAGIALSVLPGSEELPRDAQGRLHTDQFLHVQGYSNIWAGGDAALVKHPAAPGTCPVNALWAMKHGMWAGSNMALSLKGQPLKRFNYRGLGQAASLGLGNGIAELLGVPLTGPAAWLLRLFFFVWYMPSKLQGLRVLGDMLKVLNAKPRGSAVSVATPSPALVEAEVKSLS